MKRMKEMERERAHGELMESPWFSGGPSSAPPYDVARCSMHSPFHPFRQENALIRSSIDCKALAIELI